jgi:hypothetical protein
MSDVNRGEQLIVTLCQRIKCGLLGYVAFGH